MRSSHGGVAVSKTAGWGFDSFRAYFDTPDSQSGHQHLDNCRGIVAGPVATPVPEWVGRAMGRSWL